MLNVSVGLMVMFVCLLIGCMIPILLIVMNVLHPHIIAKVMMSSVDNLTWDNMPQTGSYESEARTAAATRIT